MGRWEPNARGRLAEAAMALYAEQGFEKTTAAEIAARAGLKERSFFRHFPDKPEVLFYGMDSMRDAFVRTIAAAPAGLTALEAVGQVLQLVADLAQEDPGLARVRSEIIAASSELRERELGKLAGLAADTARALRGRGVPEPTASLAAELGLAVYRVAVSRWLSGPGQATLSASIQESLDDLGNVLTARLAVPATQLQPPSQG